MKFKEQFAKLIDLKTIITLIAMSATTYGFIVKIVPAETYIPLVMMILSFYFNKDKNKEDK